MPIVGDTVTFHVLGHIKGYCPSIAAGEAGCSCGPDLSMPATVVAIWPIDYAQKTALKQISEGLFESVQIDDLKRPLPQALVLDVHFPPEMLVHVDAEGNRCEFDAEDTRPHVLRQETDSPEGPQVVDMQVSVHGFVTRQSHARQATTDPPESGSWTV